MSSDNVIYVRKWGDRWRVWEQSASMRASVTLGGDEKRSFKTRGKALVYAHDLANDTVVEYGVQEI